MNNSMNTHTQMCARVYHPQVKIQSISITTEGFSMPSPANALSNPVE